MDLHNPIADALGKPGVSAALLATGSGLLQGRDFSRGIALAGQNLMAAEPQIAKEKTDARQLAEQAKARTVAARGILTMGQRYAPGDPTFQQLADQVANGTVAAGEAFNATLQMTGQIKQKAEADARNRASSTYLKDPQLQKLVAAGDLPFQDAYKMQQTAATGGLDPTAALQEYAVAKSQGFTGTFMDYQQQIKGGGGPDLAHMGQVPLNDAGVPDPQAQKDFLAKLDPNTAALVKAVIGYQMDISKVTSLKGDQRQRLAELAVQADPTFDMTQYAARAAMRKSITSGPYSLALNSANLVIQHLDELSQAADNLHNQDFTPWNVASNVEKQMTGKPEITRFNEAKIAVASELGKVFKGSGVATEDEINNWLGTFNDASSPAQLKQAVSTAVTLLKSRIDTIQSQYNSAMGHPASFTYLTPHSRKVLSDMGIDPAALDPAASSPDGAPPDQSSPGGGTAPVYATNPQTGQRLMLQNGQWVPAK